MKASGVSFVIIRVLSSTNAGPYIDQYFHTNMQGSIGGWSSGGAYIYSYGTTDQHTDLIRYGMNLWSQNGYLPGLYTYYNAANTYINAQQLVNKDYDFWVEHYGTSVNPWPDTGMWQYTNSGSAPGINSKVDMNYSYRDYAKLNRSRTVYDLNTGKQVTGKIKDLFPQIVQNKVGSGLGLTGTDA